MCIYMKTNPLLYFWYGKGFLLSLTTIKKHKSWSKKQTHPNNKYIKSLELSLFAW